MTEIPILPTSKLLFKRATLCDIPTLLRIINAAYRSNHKNSWTNEAHLVKDPRISTEGLVRVVNSPEECLIVAFRPNVGNDDDIVGCICLEQCNDDGELIAGANQVLLGLFAVDPEIQSQGIGRFLIESALTAAKLQGSSQAFMWVLECRTELLSWYSKLGFVDSSVRKPFVAPELLMMPGIDFIILKRDLL